MKKIILYSFLCLVCLTSCQQCKKKEKAKIITTVSFYRNCNDIAANTRYYRVFPIQQYNNRAPIEFTTDANGSYSFETEKYNSETINISTDQNINHSFCYFHTSSEEDSNVGFMRESASNQLVLKLKTNHVLTSLDTIKYAFRYGDMELPVHGPITKDTIIGFYTKTINSKDYNNSPTTGELYTLWWSLNKPTVGSNDTQVDYTIHGCAGIADTAYIVVP
jgi:hypothetical protein